MKALTTIFKRTKIAQTAFAILLVYLTSIACTPEYNIQPYSPPQDFKDYWYQGEAELNRYELEQARYGEIHKGYAILVFVKEDFLKDKEVKLEHGSSKNALPVLKLNAIRKFATGIYAYSILTSVFTPFDLKNMTTLKISNSNQEWCGSTYAQINFRRGKYEGVSHSYFQNEADRKFEITRSLLEDEVWTRIRLNPQSLPVGEISIFPGLYFLRLRHHDLIVQRAVAQLSTIVDSSLSAEPVNVYTIDYQTIDRKLKIMFEPSFPYAILGWDETYKSGWGAKARELTTRARRANTLITDYWTKNSVADSTYRKMFGL
jgi:hypothetical protein